MMVVLVASQGSANINPRDKVEKPRSKNAAPRHKQQSRSQVTMNINERPGETRGEMDW